LQPGIPSDEESGVAPLSLSDKEIAAASHMDSVLIGSQAWELQVPVLFV